MAVYQQTCQCKGRAVSAVKDALRYEAEAEDIRKEIATLEREVARLNEKTRRARRRALEGELGGCQICGDTGVVSGNGCAQMGRSGRGGSSSS